MSTNVGDQELAAGAGNVQFRLWLTAGELDKRA